MFNSLKITTLLLFLFSITSLSAQVKKKNSPLEGKIYLVEVIRDGKKKPTAAEDPFKFANGKFKSAYFYEAQQLEAGSYDCAYEDSTAEVKVIKFTAEMKDKTNGDVAVFTGTVNRDAIQGTAEIKDKKGKLRDSYVFAGALKQKKVPGTKK